MPQYYTLAPFFVSKDPASTRHRRETSSDRVWKRALIKAIKTKAALRMQRSLGRSESRRQHQARAEEMKKWKQPLQWKTCCWRKHLIIPRTGIIHLGAEPQRRQQFWGRFSTPDLPAAAGGGVTATETSLDSHWALPAHEGGNGFASTSCPS